MTNSNKLKAKIAEVGLTMAELAKNIKMSSATFSQKVNGKVRFSQEDIRKIDKELNLTPEEIKDIFFKLKVRKSIKKGEEMKKIEKMPNYTQNSRRKLWKKKILNQLRP